jgi:hypothetical protein
MEIPKDLGGWLLNFLIVEYAQESRNKKLDRPTIALYRAVRLNIEMPVIGGRRIGLI